MNEPTPRGQDAAARRCAHCRTVLTIDNTASMCGKCSRDRRDQMNTPPQYESDFFETDDFIAAFRSRHIGRVLKVYRHHPRHLRIHGKALNQELLGRWLGLNQAQVSKLENGKPENNLEILAHYAKLLNMPPHLLWFDLPGQSRLVQPVSVGVSRQSSGFFSTSRVELRVEPKKVAYPAVLELRQALAEYVFSGPRMGLARVVQEPPELRDVKRDLKVTFDFYQGSRLGLAASRASTLLNDAEVAVHESDAEETGEAHGILALSYQAAASILVKAGEIDVAWVAAERGMNAARKANDPAIQGSLTRSVAYALFSSGRLDSAMRLVESGAQFLEPELTKTDDICSVYGTLLLVGAMAAARYGDSEKVADYLQEADRAALQLGHDGNNLWTAFGPTNVAIHRTNTAAELGNMGAVLTSVTPVLSSSIPVERKARYLLDVARAHASTGNHEEALRMVMSAERMAPEQVRHHYLTKEIVMAIIRKSTKAPTFELQKLMERIDLVVEK